MYKNLPSNYKDLSEESGTVKVFAEDTLPFNLKTDLPIYVSFFIHKYVIFKN